MDYNYSFANIKIYIHYLLVLFLSVFFTNCSSLKECIRFDQSYVDFRDSGHRDLYFCSSDCDFFTTYYNVRDKSNLYDLRGNVALFLSSTKIINKLYYKEIRDFVNAVLKGGIQKEGIIWVSILDTDENVLKEGTIIRKDFKLLKEKINTLNLKYNIDQKSVSSINWYFDIVEKGVITR